MVLGYEVRSGLNIFQNYFVFFIDRFLYSFILTTESKGFSYWVTAFLFRQFQYFQWNYAEPLPLKDVTGDLAPPKLDISRAGKAHSEISHTCGPICVMATSQTLYHL